MARLQFVEEVQVVEALDPATDAAGRSGDWISLKNAHRLFIVVHIQQGNAAMVALTIDQAQDNAGTGSKAITKNVPVWANQDTATSDTLVRQADAVSFTTDANLLNKIVVFQIDPEHLDVANGFDYVKVVTGASNLANVTQAMYYLANLRYAQPTPPSATS